MMKSNLLIIGMLAVSVPCFAIMPTVAPPAVRGATPPIAADPQMTKATRDFTPSSVRSKEPASPADIAKAMSRSPTVSVAGPLR